MGNYDGAEVCKLVGLYILPILQGKLGNPNIGLYRDDGLGVLHNLNACASDRKRKDITEAFKSLGLKITKEANLKTVNFLDVTPDLSNESYKPYRKPNDNPLYINASSNHPPSILKQLPKNISKRVSGISPSKQIFEQAAPYYNDALKASGYQEKSNSNHLSSSQAGKPEKKAKSDMVQLHVQHERQDKHSKKIPSTRGQALPCQP